jgi:2-oxoglutarate ferredoxin oxidoreductase subunit gamma
MTQAQETKRREIIVTGFGGQGIILAGKILGMAAALGDGRESTLVQSYGPESRGGACAAQVIISEKTIQYPYIKTPDLLVCMSQSAYEKYIDALKPDGILMIDRDLVKPLDDRECFSIPATRMAEELGRVMMANIIMIGFVTAVAGATSLDATQDAVMKSVPKGTEKMNQQAFTKGYEYGLSLLKGRVRKASGQTGATP